MQTKPTAFDALLVILGNILMAIMLQNLYLYLYSSFSWALYIPYAAFAEF